MPDAAVIVILGNRIKANLKILLAKRRNPEGQSACGMALVDVLQRIDSLGEHKLLEIHR